jgi:multiple sugar transport system substrate-binding protein
MPATQYRKVLTGKDIAPVYRESLVVWNDKVLSQTMDGDDTYLYLSHRSI